MRLAGHIYISIPDDSQDVWLYVAGVGWLTVRFRCGPLMLTACAINHAKTGRFLFLVGSFLDHLLQAATRALPAPAPDNHTAVCRGRRHLGHFDNYCQCAGICHRPTPIRHRDLCRPPPRAFRYTLVAESALVEVTGSCLGAAHHGKRHLQTRGGEPMLG